MKAPFFKLFVLFLAGVSGSACTEPAETHTKDPAATDSQVMHSAPSNTLISKDSANKMIGSYLASLPVPDSVQPDLHALILNADAIRDYLADTTIHSLKLMFAHTLDYINAGNQGVPAGYKSGAFTMVLIGYDADGNYVYAPGQLAFNRFRPCPHNCPEKGNATSDYLE